LTATPFFFALYLFCGLASATFASRVRTRWEAGMSLAGFALAAWLTSANLPDPVWVGTAAAILALGILFRPRFAPMQPVLSGAFAGLLASLVQAQGVPVWAALPCAAAIPLICAWLASRNPGFAPLPVQEEALLFIGIFGLLTAAAPGIAAGWNSAGGMNLVDNKEVPAAIPTWVLALGSASAAVGGVFAVWRRS
jgi:hypothetical protein